MKTANRVMGREQVGEAAGGQEAREERSANVVKPAWAGGLGPERRNSEREESGRGFPNAGAVSAHGKTRGKV